MTELTKGQGWHSGSSTARSSLTPPEEGHLPSWPNSANTTLLRAWPVVGAQEEVRAVAVVSAHPVLELCWNQEGKRKERCSFAGMHPASCSPWVHERLGIRGDSAGTVPSTQYALSSPEPWEVPLQDTEPPKEAAQEKGPGFDHLVSKMPVAAPHYTG